MMGTSPGKGLGFISVLHAVNHKSVYTSRMASINSPYSLLELIPISRADGSGADEVIIWQDTDGYTSSHHFGGGMAIDPASKHLYLGTGDKYQGSVYSQNMSQGGGKLHRINLVFALRILSFEI